MLMRAVCFAVVLSVPTWPCRLPAQVTSQVREDPAWVREDRDRGVVYRVAGTEGISVRRDVVYKQVDGMSLRFDVYARPDLDSNERLPVVVLIHGGWLPANLLTEPKEWGQFRSLGRVLAASGFIGVAFNHRFFRSMNALPDAESDLLALIAYLRSHADTLRIDRDRVVLWAFSGSGLLLTHALRTSPTYIRALVAYYAFLDLTVIERTRPGSIDPAVASTFAPLRVLEAGGAAIPPLLLVRAGLDRPEINEPLDTFERNSRARGAPVELLTYPEGHHGFDLVDDTERSRQIIEHTIEFVRTRTRD